MAKNLNRKERQPIRSRGFLSLCMVFVLVGCVGIAPVGPGTFQVKDGKGGYQVTLGETWTAYPLESAIRLQALTIDGLGLNVLRFGVAIEDGQALIRSSDPQKLIPRFRADMSPGEVAEFLRDTLIYVGLKDVTLSSLRPETFGGREGLRADMRAAQAGGLALSGMIKAAIVEETLYLVLYYAPSEYYYGLHKDEVDRILSSIKLL